MSTVKKCPGKEGFERINYLYQISNLMATKNQSCHVAASLYSNLLVNVSRKTVQRLDIQTKRTLCKSCRCLLLAGITCKVRVKKQKVTWTCLHCKKAKVFETRDRNYECWTEKPESLVETLDYSLGKDSETNKKN
ncbi:unnamed protein product [Phyllotreta striolata]|uniref:Uncharacterized protein n=1 Tax=Phyllotreta striolata TaxID=444603 RepID=A0A9N9TZV1_PHYSR|nr:unnamed protein product [Phyllotreta striolata]